MSTSLSTDLALALDPVLFAQSVGIEEPDPWQVDFLRSTAPRVLLNCCRQAGKSTMKAVIAVHTALYQPGSLVLLLSPGIRQSGELFKKCLAVYKAAGRPVPADSETALTLTLDNGSRIVSLPGKEATTRGYSGVRLLIVDEGSRVLDDLYMAVRPMLAVSSGRLLAGSTPFGKRGWWFNSWRSEEAWERYEVPATECPRISAAFLEEERKALPWQYYTQEYENQFVEAEGAIFRYEDIEGMFDPSLQPLFPVPTSSEEAAELGEEESELERLVFV